MENNQLVRVEVDFNDLLNVHFDAEEIPCQRGKIYREKKFEKNSDELAYITLYAEERRIMLRIGVVYLTFIVKSGNLDVFEGHYDVSYLGYDGTADVLQAENE